VVNFITKPTAPPETVDVEIAGLAVTPLLFLAGHGVGFGQTVDDRLLDIARTEASRGYVSGGGASIQDH